MQRELLSHDLRLSTLPNDGYLMLEKWQENCTKEASKSSPAKKARPTSTCRLPKQGSPGSTTSLRQQRSTYKMMQQFPELSIEKTAGGKRGGLSLEKLAYKGENLTTEQVANLLEENGKKLEDAFQQLGPTLECDAVTHSTDGQSRMFDDGHGPQESRADTLSATYGKAARDGPSGLGSRADLNLSKSDINLLPAFTVSLGRKSEMQARPTAVLPQQDRQTETIKEAIRNMQELIKKQPRMAETPVLANLLQPRSSEVIVRSRPTYRAASANKGSSLKIWRPSSSQKQLHTK